MPLSSQLHTENKEDKTVLEHATEHTHHIRHHRRLIFKIIGVSLLVWWVAAYALAPLVWKVLARTDPAFDGKARITETSDRHPGDPLNVALIGTEAQILDLMKAAKWYAADALGVKSDLKLAADTVLSRPDDAAPVSNLYLFGRKEDLAFEQQVGGNPRHRHHVRFWKTDDLSDDGRPKWIGSAVYDQRIGLSETTGQITHVTASDIDAERNYLFDCLEKTGDIRERSIVNGFHKQTEGRNGGGDPWRTDGGLAVGIIRNSSD